MSVRHASWYDTIVDDTGVKFTVLVQENVGRVLYRIIIPGERRRVHVAKARYSKELHEPASFWTAEEYRGRGIARQLGALMYRDYPWEPDKPYKGPIATTGQVLHPYWGAPPKLNKQEG